MQELREVNNQLNIKIKEDNLIIEEFKKLLK